jgi:hypothetical protein
MTSTTEHVRPPRLPAGERARLLGLIGVDRYLRRTPALTADVASSAPPEPVVSRPPRLPRAASAPLPSVVEPMPERTSLIEELGAIARTPRLLLIVESPRAPDPRTRPMLAAIRSLLPPHQVIAAGDTPEKWPDYAIALGGRLQAPASTLFVQSLSPQYLLGNARAKRDLWRALRALLRTLGRA